MDPQNGDGQINQTHDYDVFRVPPKEMLDKYSQANSDLPVVDNSGGTDKSKMDDFGLDKKPAQVQPVQKSQSLPQAEPMADQPTPQISQTNEAPKIAASGQSPIAPTANNNSSVLPSNKPQISSDNGNQVEDIFSSPVKPGPLESGSGQGKEGNGNNKQTDGEFKKPRSFKSLIIILIIILILVPLALIALEWFGIFSLSLSKYIGSSPTSIAWLRTKFNFSDFSTSFSGTITLDKTNLSSEMSKWLKDNKFDGKENLNFSGSFVKTADIISGAIALDNGTPTSFRLENSYLYLQKNDGKWYKLSFPISGISQYFESLQEIFNNKNNFISQKPEVNNVFSYSGNLGANMPQVLVDLNNKNFKLEKVNLEENPLSFAGIGIDMQFTDFSNDIIELTSINTSQALGGEKEFSALNDLAKIILATYGKETAQNSQTSVNVTEDEANINDASRKDDLQKIAQMLASYKEDNGVYPVAAKLIKLEEDTKFQDSLTPYLPLGITTWGYQDPLWPANYYGYQSVDGANFELSAVLQNANDEEGTQKGNLFLYILTQDSDISS